MRGSTLLWLILVATPALAQQMFRWESKDGETHYTDDRSTIPRGVKVFTTEGAEIGELKHEGAATGKPITPSGKPSGTSGSHSSVLRAPLAQAQALATAGKCAAALELITEAATLAGDDSEKRTTVASACANIAAERIGSGFLDDASRFVRRGRDLDSDNPHVRLAAGDLAWAHGDSATAVSDWEKGLRESPNDPQLLKRVADYRKKTDAFKAVGLSSSKWVTVTFDGAEDTAMAAYTIKTIEEGRTEINALYGYDGEQRVEVILYSNRTFETLSPNHPTWAGGFYDGRIHVPTGGRVQLGGEFQATLLHEYAHRVLARVVLSDLGMPQGSHPKGFVPRWFDEGLAEISARGALGVAIPCAQGHIAPLQSLQGPFSSPNPGVIRADYFESRHAAEWLISRYGTASISKVLHGLAAGQSFEDAFERATGVGYAEFARRFDKIDPAH